MPFIHIRSLPLAQPIDVSAVIRQLAQDFSADTGIALQHITTTWDDIPAGRYAVGGITASEHTQDSHPLLVDLLAPDSNDDDMIATMLRSVAASLARQTGLPQTNIFIAYGAAHAGQVFDAGEVVQW